MTANRISEIFGVRLTKKLRGKLAAVAEQIEHGQHVFRVIPKTLCFVSTRSSLDSYATKGCRTTCKTSWVDQAKQAAQNLTQKHQLPSRGLARVRSQTNHGH
jgi:hypothetical protein